MIMVDLAFQAHARRPRAHNTTFGSYDSVSSFFSTLWIAVYISQDYGFPFCWTCTSHTRGHAVAGPSPQRRDSVGLHRSNGKFNPTDLTDGEGIQEALRRYRRARSAFNLPGVVSSMEIGRARPSKLGMSPKPVTLRHWHYGMVWNASGNTPPSIIVMRIARENVRKHKERKSYDTTCG